MPDEHLPHQERLAVAGQRRDLVDVRFAEDVLHAAQNRMIFHPGRDDAARRLLLVPSPMTDPGLPDHHPPVAARGIFTRIIVFGIRAVRVLHVMERMRGGA